MAGQIRVKIDGTLVEKVVAVDTGLNVAMAMDGHPEDSRPRLNGIAITRESDKNKVLWDWATKPWAEATKDGEIEFLDPKKEDSVIKKITWKKGFLTSYTEVVADTQGARSAPMTESIQIAVQEMDMDGAKITAYEV